MNNKSVYYFPHDFNASQDPKLIKLQRDMGGDGLAIYWKLIERLGPETDHKLQADKESYDSLEWDLHFPAALIEKVVNNYGLFVVEDGYFYSKSLTERLHAMEDSREKRRRAGQLGGRAKAENAQNLSNATTISGTATQNCSKENKERNERNERNESKENKDSIDNNNDNNNNNNNNKNKQKVEPEMSEPETPAEQPQHNWSEKVTDTEYLGIVANMMKKLSCDPCEEADGLIDMMDPGWKGQYDDFFEQKDKATSLWTVKRERKYAQYPRATIDERKSIDIYVETVKRAKIYDKWVFNAYRGMRLQEDGTTLILYVVNEKAASYIDKKYIRKFAPFLREKFGDKVSVLYQVKSTN